MKLPKNEAELSEWERQIRWDERDRVLRSGVGPASDVNEMAWDALGIKRGENHTGKALWVHIAELRELASRAPRP